MNFVFLMKTKDMIYVLPVRQNLVPAGPGFTILKKIDHAGILDMTNI